MFLLSVDDLNIDFNELWEFQLEVDPTITLNESIMTVFEFIMDQLTINNIHQGLTNNYANFLRMLRIFIKPLVNR